MSSSFEIPSCERFTFGALGEPGRRIFYMQALASGELISFKCEKEQVGAIGEYLDRILSDLPDRHLDELPQDMELIEPVIPEWAVGSVSVAYDRDDDELVMMIEELRFDDDESEEELATARFTLTREQLNALVNRSRSLLEAGRPPCRLCGRPLDPDGHMCPRTNGHRG